MRVRAFGLAILLAGQLIPLGSTAQAQDHDANAGSFGFRFLGPVVGNRVASFAAAPGDHLVYYAGSSSGGIFKSEDGGASWKPIFDKQNVAAIGALAVAPSNPRVIYAGTGEAWAIRDIDVIGNGMYKSTDAGKTWQHIGLDNSGRIGRILVDPNNPDSVWACALGRLPAPQQQRGVFHSSDGGKTWKRQLFVDANTGCSGLSMDAHDPKTIFAGTWQVKMNTWGEYSGGPGSGVYVTHDGGAHWQHIVGHGLPTSPVGKIDVAVAPTDSSRVYALIQTNGLGSLWRSDDGGRNWKTVSWDRKLTGRGGYYIHLMVSPADADRIIVANSSVSESTDGGKTFKIRPWGGDSHDIWWDPKDAKHFVVTDDGGINLTVNGGISTRKITFPIGQMYHVAVDDQIPYEVYTNMQDNSTMRGPSIPVNGYPSDKGWDHHMGGCESGFTLPAPGDPNTVWASCYANEVTVWDAKTDRARSVSPWLHTMDAEPDKVPYRCHWTPPLAIDPFDADTVYYGCQVIFKTTDKGQSWKVVSPDLSHRDPKYIHSSGGIVADNLGQFAPEVVFAIAPSKIRQGLVWAGTDDGKIWYTPDGGGKWVDVTAGLKGTGVPELATVTSIEPSPFDPGTAYASFDSHLYNDDGRPYIVRTTDYGKTWTLINGDLPTSSPLDYVRNVSEDPNAKGLLFAGTGHAFYYSLDDGAHWTHLRTGLPPSPVTWTVTQKRFHDLVISTYGRGIYILDDISPLEAMAKNGRPTAATFFKPRNTYLLRNEKAYFTYWLPKGAKGDATVTIAKADGTPVRTLHTDVTGGMNRVDWNMHYDPLVTIRLRTIPPENPHIWDDARFKGKKWRPITHWGMPSYQPGPLIVPGQYKVSVNVDGKTFEQPLTILPDPSAPGSQSDLQKSLDLQLRIRKDVDSVSKMVNLIEHQRHELEELRAKGGGGLSPAQIDAMDAKLKSVEYQMFQKALAASDDKYYVSVWKIYYNLLWLNAEIGSGAGDVAGGEGYGPTDTTPPLLDGLEQQLAKATQHYDTVMSTDVPAFNKLLVAKGQKPLMTVLPAADMRAPDREESEGFDYAEADAD
ncbi:hypothetical protein GCM10023219_28500 [Stakelama sediminis]|uniref:Photosystem II stability/assembly factor-like uncharacterized protein n=1 Tax=Stakelama sediminis TaxID=463200 RepID=A0A840YY62_9SPHN|nr:sialidase family protein [Stakelama sediminis]MBB5718464.1 photosystem II stability/assembly factor-like uncharacterized protein [Stakelama sediminis]